MLKTFRVTGVKIKSTLKNLKKKGARLIAISDLRNDLVYHLILDGKPINIRLELNPESPEADSMTDVYANAELYEREIMEKSGIKIRGHPNPKKLFTE